MIPYWATELLSYWPNMLFSVAKAWPEAATDISHSFDLQTWPGDAGDLYTLVSGDLSHSSFVFVRDVMN